MENKEYLLVENICTYHKIDISLMDSLHSQGLLNLIYIDDQKYLFHEDLKETEKMIRLYDEMSDTTKIPQLVKMNKKIHEKLNKESNKESKLK